MTVSVPSPCELNASIVAGLKTAPSTPVPMGSDVMILPSVFMITMVGVLRQPTNRILFLASNARPAGTFAFSEMS